MSQPEDQKVSKEAISKTEVAYSLYAQAEQQLVAAIQNNDSALQKAQEQVQTAQANRIALNAQLALIRKVNEKVNELTAPRILEQAPTTDASV